MTNKPEMDRQRWNANPPVMPEGWTRYPVTAEMLEQDTPWEAVPDEVYEPMDFTIMEEWRTSSMGGHGLAAIWVGPKETK